LGGRVVFKNIFLNAADQAGAGTEFDIRDNTFEGGTRIVAGTLRVDGALKNSAVR
jgi:hypothetical protein